MAQDQTTRQPILGETGYRLLGLTKDWGRYGAARAWHFIAAAPDAPFVAPEPTRHKPRPRPAAAPTGMNSAPTLLAAMASCYNITEQDEILQKLANALNDFKITALPGGKNTAVFMATTAMTVAIDNAHVLTEKEVLTPDDAHKLALLALANPAMRANGLSVSGNAADRYILQRAAESLGLKVLNPVTDATPEIRAAIDKEWDSYVIATPAPDKDKKTSPRDDLNKAARPTKPEPDTSPIAPAIAEMLKAGKVDEDTYRAARALVVHEQKATLTLLRNELHIGARKAHVLMDVLAADGVIETEKSERTVSRTRHTVLVKPGDLTATWQSAASGEATPEAATPDTAKAAPKKSGPQAQAL